MVPFQESPAFCPEIVGVIVKMTITKMKTYLLKQTVKIYMDNIPSIGVQENIFTMSITEPSRCMFSKYNITKKTLRCLYPRINPTIDITAAVRPYVNLLANHAVGSGKVSINHS